MIAVLVGGYICVTLVQLFQENGWNQTLTVVMIFLVILIMTIDLLLAVFADPLYWLFVVFWGCPLFLDFLVLFRGHQAQSGA